MPDPSDEFVALQAIIQALQPFEPADRERVLTAAAMFLGLRGVSASAPLSGQPMKAPQGSEIDTASSHSGYPPFSTPDATSPKDFLFEKQPRSDVERIAVLAFYLTHYRDTPHFKTLDLSKLNTEAAQPKFSNAANSAGNAVKQGYLVPSTKGMRQLSAIGERFVAALPDRDTARASMATVKPRKRNNRKPAATQAGSQ